MAKIKVLSKEITIQTRDAEDYISLTDIARYKDAERTDYIIQNWLRNRNTIEFLGVWEEINNTSFSPIEFDGIRNQAGLSSSPGKYGGTFAHKDIAFEFASWISVEFKLYVGPEPNAF